MSLLGGEIVSYDKTVKKNYLLPHACAITCRSVSGVVLESAL